MHPATYILLAIAFALLVLAGIMHSEQKYYGKPKDRRRGTLGSRQELIAFFKEFPDPKPKEKETKHHEKHETIERYRSSSDWTGNACGAVFLSAAQCQ